MKRSTDKILTSHTGSLPRPKKVVELMFAEIENPGPNKAAFDAAVQSAVDGVVQKQMEVGIDVINDGEQGRPDYTSHVKDRLAGFEGESTAPLGTGTPEFPELAEMLRDNASPFQNRPACSGPVGWKDWPAAELEIAQAKQAMAKANAPEFFMTCPSPGQIARYLKNNHYKTDEEYVFALAEVMNKNYKAIVDAGILLQLDCPDLAMCRHTVCKDMDIPEYRDFITLNVAALNESVKDIPAESMRMHVCWGSTMDPHHTDVDLKDIIDIVLTAKPAAVSFPAANARHGHEWKVWRDVELPEGKTIIPGVIDSTTNIVEHPELVADRIVQYAEIVGKENVIAGVDCGFGTFAGRVQVDSKIVWMKLDSLVQGAKKASEQLW